MPVLLASPHYTSDLGNGLVRRWSTAADQEKIAHCMATVFRDSPDAPLNHRIANEARITFIPGFPLMRADDCALVEDTSLPDRPVVASVCYWRHRWSLGGIAFDVGRPEYVATLAAYRNRGLMRSLFEMVHARSAANGDLVQAITGIEYYYRQFGYEYVLDLGGRRLVQVAAIPAHKEDAPEPYRLRPATLEDVPHLHDLYNQRRSASLVWSERTEADWRYYITVWDEPVVRDQEPASVGLAVRLHMVVNNDDQVCGYVAVATKRRGRSLGIDALELLPHINWQAAMPSLLRALCAVGRQTPISKPDAPPFDELILALGREHPAYTVLGDDLALRRGSVYAWYLRVADIPGFVRHIAPLLKQRLADSILAGYSGEVKINFYRSGLRLQFEQGELTAAEPWQTPAYGDAATAGCPALIFLQLLFGYRSLAELRAIFPDVQAKAETALLLDILFPKQPSSLLAMGYT